MLQQIRHSPCRAVNQKILYGFVSLCTFIYVRPMCIMRLFTLLRVKRIFDELRRDELSIAIRLLTHSRQHTQTGDELALIYYHILCTDAF